MSVIYFRGKPILPPLINKDNNNCMLESKTNKISKVETDEENLLSASSQEALHFLLIGVNNKNCKITTYNLQDNLFIDDNELKNIDGNRNSKLHVDTNYYSSNNVEITEKMLAHPNNTQNPSFVIEHKTSPITSESISDIESGICSDSINGGDCQKLDVLSGCKETNLLKHSSNAIAYLEDYLGLLTNRSCYNLYGSMDKTKSDNDTSPEENGQCLVHSSDMIGKQAHNRSVSSDKSVRSLGSAYMDGYLGTLTDYSWITYPSQINDILKSPVHGNELEQLTSNDWSIHPGNSQQKLQYINPDLFLHHPNMTEKISSGINILSTPITDNNNPVMGSPTVQDFSTSTDIINSSIFDKDFDDSMIDESCKSFPESDREISIDDNSVNTVVNGQNSVLALQAAYLSSQDMYKGPDVQNSPNIIAFSSTNINRVSTLESEFSNVKYNQPQYDNKNIPLQEEFSDFVQHSEVCRIEKLDDSSMDTSVSVYCTKNDEPLASNYDFSINTELNGSDKFPAIVHQKLLKFLKSKHKKELDNLRHKHEEEINELKANFPKLSLEQVKELEIYITKNDSVENIYEICSQLMEVGKDKIKDEELSVKMNMSISNSMPSFFLHDDPVDKNNIELVQTDQISKLFSPRSHQCLPPSSFTQQPINQPGLLYCQGEMKFYHRDGPPNMLSPIKEMSTSEVLEAQLSYYKHLETGLDFIPARQNDLLSLERTFELTQSVLYGICKLQALVRGRRIRNLMVTEKVKELLSTLMEVSKLANQFHTDILTDNIRKGDVEFHKALFNQEQTARQKLWNLLVELPATEQIKIIHQDVEVKCKMRYRIVSTHGNNMDKQTQSICRSSSMPLPQNNISKISPENRKKTRLHIPKKIPQCALRTEKSSPRQVVSESNKIRKKQHVAGMTRHQSISPCRSDTKRHPLSPRKFATVSNLPTSQNGVRRSDLLKESTSRKNVVVLGKPNGTGKQAVSKFTDYFCKMVSNYKRKTDRQNWTKENMDKALEAVNTGTPIATAAKRYNIDRTTLWRRMKNEKGSEKGLGRFKPVFSVEQEKDLC